MNTTELIAQVRADIAARKTMPDFGPETSIERIKTINATQRSFTPETVEALVEALESAQRKIAELESRAVTVRLPVTFWYEHDDLSRDVAVLDKRLVKKAIRDACERAGIKCEVKGE